MSYTQLKQQILDNDLCARCGACVAVCPQNILGIQSNGEPFSLISDTDSKCERCTLCLDSCPGLETDVIRSEKRLFGRNRTPEERWTGIYRKAFLVAAKDPKVLYRASAGGAATSLLITALRSGLVDAVIVIGRNPKKRWVPTAILTNEEDIVIEAAQSSYCLTPNLQLLKNPSFNHVGIVGVPCEIQALNKIKNIPELKELSQKITFTIEIGCASSTKIEGTEYLIEKNLGLPLTKVREVRYREGEYPGKFTVYTNDDQKYEVPFYELVNTFKKFKTHRCLTCPDWWSGLADISIADGDPNIYASSIKKTGIKRCSTLLTRTKIGEDLLQRAIDMEILSVQEAHFDPEKSLGLQRKRFRSAHYARALPNGVPTRPVANDVLDEECEDEKIIKKMSNI